MTHPAFPSTETYGGFAPMTPQLTPGDICRPKTQGPGSVERPGHAAQEHESPRGAGPGQVRDLGIRG